MAPEVSVSGSVIPLPMPQCPQKGHFCPFYQKILASSEEREVPLNRFSRCFPSVICGPGRVLGGRGTGEGVLLSLAS